MTKEPQPTTHNAERGARGMCREGSETGLFPVVWRKRLARYVGVLEEACSVIWRTLIRRFSVKKCVGDLGESFWRKNRSAILEIWRKLLGEIVVGDLE